MVSPLLGSFHLARGNFSADFQFFFDFKNLFLIFYLIFSIFLHALFMLFYGLNLWEIDSNSIFLLKRNCLYWMIKFYSRKGSFLENLFLTCWVVKITIEFLNFFLICCEKILSKNYDGNLAENLTKLGGYSWKFMIFDEFLRKFYQNIDRNFNET